MHHICSRWIVAILENNVPIIKIALRQRAKFEGWLKFELASFAEREGATSVEVEAKPEGDTRSRVDIAFTYNGIRYNLELKTPNSSWRMSGIQKKTRPITANIADIIKDAQKLQRFLEEGIVAFVLFPIPPGDTQWQQYLERISKELAIPLSVTEHCHRVTIPLDADIRVDLIVCCFAV